MARMGGMRANSLRLGVVMGLVALVMAVLPLLKGELIVAKHEGDTLHLADLVLRMAEAGQIPHFDFMTPLGILSIWPIAVFVEAGLGIGMAFLAAQAALALVLFGPILRTALSRFTGWFAWGFAAYVIVLVLALVHGEANPAISVSMHYNRWAWALAYIAIPLAMLEPLGPRRPLLDGTLIGLALAAMALIKVTYFAAFFPAIVIALLARRDWKTLLIALLAGLAVAAAVTGIFTTRFWFAYLRDLFTVATSATRAAPGLSLGGILVAPAYMAGTFAVLASVIFLRQSGAMVAGLVLLFLMPGFVYVTYQNFGNDPQWLILLALLALGLRPETTRTNALGIRLDQALLVAGTFALALGAASAINMIWSPFRLYFSTAEEVVPLLSQRPQHHDILVGKPRVYRVVMNQMGWDELDTYSDYVVPLGDEDTPPLAINGETLADCELSTGYNAWFETTARTLEGAGYGGSGVLVADLFSALWLYGDFKPLEGGAPWYYAGTPGLDAAEHVLVPLCPTNLPRRAEILKAIETGGWTLSEEMRTETFILYRPSKG